MKKIILIYLLLYAGISSKGQVEKLILPADLKQQTIVTEPVTLRKGYFRAETGIRYFAQDKYFNSSGGKEYYPLSTWGSHYRFDLSLKYGITDRIEIDLTVPVVNERIENYYLLKMPVLNADNSFSGKLKGRNVGDCNLMFLFQVIPEKENKISLTLYNDIIFPTGPKNPTGIKDVNNYKLPTGHGYFSTGIWLCARKISYPYSYSALAYYYYNFWGSKLILINDISETKFKKGNRVMLSGRFNIHLNEWIALANEFCYFHTAKGKEEGEFKIITDPEWEFDYIPRLVFQVRRFRMSQFIQMPLFGKNVSADPMYSMSVQYTF